MPLSAFSFQLQIAFPRAHLLPNDGPLPAIRYPLSAFSYWITLPIVAMLPLGGLARGVLTVLAAVVGNEDQERVLKAVS